jgi:hypothetical protein
VDPWERLFVFPETAFACELFVCVTGPSFPGLSIRITTLTFVGATCVEVAVAFASWFVGALCSADCDWPPLLFWFG